MCLTFLIPSYEKNKPKSFQPHVPLHHKLTDNETNNSSTQGAAVHVRNRSTWRKKKKPRSSGSTGFWEFRVTIWIQASIFISHLIFTSLKETAQTGTDEFHTTFFLKWAVCKSFTLRQGDKFHGAASVQKVDQTKIMVPK